MRLCRTIRSCFTAPVRWLAPIGFSLLVVFASSAQPITLVQFLSGHGKDDAVPWRFQCTSGAQSGFWTNLPVPAQWELHGFGTLNYHRDLTNAYAERGLYQHDFTVPADWCGRRIFLVFDGVMTDTSAELNGQSVGPQHQGGYYQFRYEITPLLRFGQTNHLAVTVAKHSANASVNGAERTGDFWMYGGIYRPVRLEAFPTQFIRHVALDARADGTFRCLATLDSVPDGDTVEAQVQTLAGQDCGSSFAAPVQADSAQLVAHISHPALWSAETPNLYQVRLRLRHDHQIRHEIVQRFGFRTFEVRDGDGLYLNGHRIVLQGCNRHSFWPDSGRCLSDAIQRLDVSTLKEMNMNAVRMSHYPPDAAFLDECDRQGLYVLDELAGWHKCYDTPTGTRLVTEMVERDVNHPCVLFWDNGNEGGFNTNLDALFDQADPQQRRVLHPWAPFGGLNTAHYLPYNYLPAAVLGQPISFHKNHYIVATNNPLPLIFMPTEFLHGLFDGGAGTGLADVWRLMRQSPYLGGGFIWAYLDEGVRHPPTDEIDVCGNEAPDGIVGPYREREASFYAIKQVWCPLEILETNLPPDFAGRLTVRNHFSFTDAGQCRFHWQIRRFIPVARADNHDRNIVAEGDAPAVTIPPGGQGKVDLSWPNHGWQAAADSEGEYLFVRIQDPSGHELWTYSWRLPQPETRQRTGEAPVAEASDFGPNHSDPIRLTAGSLEVKLDGPTGELLEVRQAGQPFSLARGPRAVGTNATIQSIAWKLFAGGRLQCHYTGTVTGTNDYWGVTFDYPEGLLRGKRWFGDGPYRVWKNRTVGVLPGLWQNAYNNTITGWRGWVYPEFKGCFANVRWLQLQTAEGRITVVNDSGIPYLQVSNPEFPPANLAGHTLPSLPTCGLGLLAAIPPVGSKFQAPEEVSPSGARSVASGSFAGTVTFQFSSDLANFAASSPIPQP